MALAPIFRGYVDEAGKLQPDSPHDLKAHVRTYIGKRVEIVIRRERSQRSLNQNAYWHGVVFPLLADAFGYDKDEIPALKLALMGECWGYQRDPISGRELPIRPHTSELTTAEGAEFTEWLIQFGAKHDVIIPLPNEVDLSAFHGEDAA